MIDFYLTVLLNFYVALGNGDNYTLENLISPASDSITIGGVALSPSKNFLAIAGFKIGLVVVDTKTNEVIYQLHDPKSFSSFKIGLFWCNENVILVSNKSQITIVDLTKKQPVFDNEVQNNDHRFGDFVFSSEFCFFAVLGKKSEGSKIIKIYKLDLRNYQLNTLLDQNQIQANKLYNPAFVNDEFLFIRTIGPDGYYSPVLKKMDFRKGENGLITEPKIPIEDATNRIFSKRNKLYLIRDNGVTAYSLSSLEKIFRFKKGWKFWKKMDILSGIQLDDLEILITCEAVVKTTWGGFGKIIFYSLTTGEVLYEYILKSQGVPYNIEYLSINDGYRFYVGSDRSFEIFEVSKAVLKID